MNKPLLTKADDLINSATNIVITAHKNPDGDAVGSTLALLHYLNFREKNATVILPNGFPDFFDWMPLRENILLFDTDTEKSEQLILAADLIFSLDYNTLHRTGDMMKPLEKSSAKFILIDHHQMPDEFDINFSDTHSCSTAQMIYQFCSGIEENDSWLTIPLAQCIYTGILTDSGSFRFNSVTEETHLIIAHLKRKGLDHAEVHQNVYDTNLIGKLQLLGHALSKKLELLADGKAAIISLSQEELDTYNYKSGDTEGLVNYALSLSGVLMAVMVKEGNNMVKMSFRSKGELDVNTFARENFNGGGHKNAAGGVSFESYLETLEKVKKDVNNYLT